MIELTRAQARNLIFDSQGLRKKYAFGSGSRGLQNCFANLGYVQIDSINVVERAHHQTLFNRVKKYQPEQLASIFNKVDGIFDYWAHAASFLPMDLYRFSLFEKVHWRRGASVWFEENSEVIESVLARIRAEGELSARQFDNDKNSNKGWWRWKPAKKALEQLFIQGHIMVSRRKGIEKFFDLPERVLPAGLDVSLPDETEYFQIMVLRSLRANGVATLKEIPYLRGKLKPKVLRVLGELIEQGRVFEVKIEGLEEIHYGLCERLEQKIDNPKSCYILCPFDNLIIQRERFAKFFGFEYRIECYTPKEKRRYGYFTHPVFMDGEFVGLLDLKADRKYKILRVLKWSNLYQGSRSSSRERISFEKGSQLDKTLKELAIFNQCEGFDLG